jgi:hypothetical protein
VSPSCGTARFFRSSERFGSTPGGGVADGSPLRRLVA